MATPDDEELVWQAPPEDLKKNRNPGQYSKYARMLKERPQQWAVIPTKSTNIESLKGLATNIRVGKVKGFEPRGAFECLFDSSTVTMYARYVGVQDDA